MTDTPKMQEQLYPFLHGEAKDPALENAALLESIKQKAASSVSIKLQFFEDHAQDLVDTAEVISTCYRGGGRLLTMGNGGSSCDAAHLAVEFQHPVTAGRPALPAQNLSMDTAMLSAVANDVGIDQIFARQIEALAKPQDVVVGFSTSGNSKNLITGFEMAKKMQLTTVGLAGGDGGEMRSSGLVDHCLIVASSSIHRVQEVHVTMYHILWDLVHTQLADTRGRLKQTTQTTRTK